MTSEQPRPLNPADPADAVQILDHLMGRLRMDGLTGGEVAALMSSVNTLRSAVQELAAVTQDRNEKAAQLADLLNAEKPAMPATDHG